jgi:uncharacterized protein (TIGR00369 family)
MNPEGNNLAAKVRLMASGRIPLPGYDRHMGFRLVSLSDTEAVFEADVDAGMHNPTGVLHGGVVAGLADSAMGILMGSLVPDGLTCANSDLHVRFLRPTSSGKLTAKAHVVRQGRTVSMLECDVSDGEGRLVGRASTTFLVFRARESAKQGA